jgi:hypothetical protein
VALFVINIDGFGDLHGDILAIDHDLAPGDEFVVSQDPDIILHRGIQLNDRATAHEQKLMDRHFGAADYHGVF